MQSILVWLESTGLARSVGESLSMTAWLSAIHAIGFTLVMSGGVVWNLRATGLLLVELPNASVARPARNLMLVGLAISVLTGFALFAPRAMYVAFSGAFQLKMIFMMLASLYQLAVGATVLRKSEFAVSRLRASGVLGLLLWFSLALTACWFILFE